MRHCGHGLGVPLVAQPARGAARLGVVHHHVLVAVGDDDGVLAALLELLDAVQDAAPRRPQLHLLDEPEERHLLAVVARLVGVGRHRDCRVYHARSGRSRDRDGGEGVVLPSDRRSEVTMARRAASGFLRLMPACSSPARRSCWWPPRSRRLRRRARRLGREPSRSPATALGHVVGVAVGHLPSVAARPPSASTSCAARSSASRSAACPHTLAVAARGHGRAVRRADGERSAPPASAPPCPSGTSVRGSRRQGRRRHRRPDRAASPRAAARSPCRRASRRSSTR